ncbi:MAG TPA: hypothetical protein DF715_05210, partial [Oceanicaulis sp.]|nr:hypothetical protein [Oceanicaulis sp.]
MKISVITPSFNQAQFLPFNLKSVASQQYPDVEHIIIDPGSTDGSTEIARAAGHAILIAEPDRGQSDGITKGFARATGDILTWLNSDDFYPSDQVLDLVARAFEQNSGIDVIYGKVNFVDDRGEFLRKGYVNPKAETLLESFHYQVGIVQPGLFMRRSVFEAVGGPSEQYEYCMDYEYWVRIASAGFKWKHVDEVLAHHRWWEGMKTSKGRDASLVEHMRVCSDYFGYIHWKWLDRYAEYLSSNKDGVVNHSTATDPDVKARTLRSVIERFVSQDMLRKLGHADGQQQRDTLDFIRKHAPELPRYYFNAEEISGMVESHPDPKATQRTAWHVFDGVDSKLRHYRTYKVPDNFHRAFDAKWYEGTLQSGRDKLRQLAERKKSDTCVIVANGPSLNNTDLSLLTDVDVIISNFATLNETLLKSATILTVTNTLVAEQADVLFNNLRTTKVLPVWLSHRINPTEETAFVGATVRPDFCTSLDSEFSWRSTVSYFNMQLAYALGYKRVLLIGFDHSYVQPDNVKEGDRIDQTGDDHNHFDPRYFKGKTWQAADTGNMETVYKLAKAAFEADGREIINCTVGGHLEVFRRGDLASELAAGNVLPGRSGDAPARHPRMLVFDLTRLGDGTATGEIKRNVLGDWPKDRYMQVYNANGSALGIIRPDAETVLAGASDLSPIDAAVAAFRPEVILYRPVPDAPLLHKAAMHIIRENADVPLVTWIMDDWIARLEQEDPGQFAVLDTDWRALLASSSLRLSISEKMSKVMETRYGGSFLPIANGVDPKDWPKTERPTGRPFTIRYGGGLADNMTADSVLRVAQAIENLACCGIEAQLEIQTRPIWHDKQGKRYSNLRRTSFYTDLLTSDQYRKWLSEADAVLIAYNFDAASLRYIGLSMANKMPECLASGAPLIAHGPAETATIAYLKQQDCAMVVETPDARAVAEAIMELVNRPDLAASLIGKARQVAFENHNIFRIRSQFASALISASKRARPQQLPPAEILRTQQAHVDEAGVVAHLLSARKGPEHVMLDVGAHFGTSAQYFDELGWTIHCFEPDPKNREKLVARFGNAKNVTIDPRAVSDKPASGVSFFSSEESTGISGLSAVRETHKESAKVDITTVAEIVRDQKITRVDFLKIDVEGFDFGVLKGVPWNRLKPDVVECEFEDAMTVALGHTWKDIADFLRGQGYHVYVSEWHPIVRYGIPHDWRRVYKYPGPSMDASAWGNFLAFREDPGFEVVSAAFNALVQFRARSKPSQLSHQRVASSERVPAVPLTKETDAPISPAFVQNLKKNTVRGSQALMKSLHITIKSLAGVLARRSRLLVLLVVLVLPASLITLHPAAEPYRWLILAAACLAAIFVSISYLGYNLRRFVQVLSRENADLRKQLRSVADELNEKAADADRRARSVEKRLRSLDTSEQDNVQHLRKMLTDSEIKLSAELRSTEARLQEADGV